MKTPLNLASRPFRNERLPALAFAFAAVALLALSVQHGLVLRRLLSARTSAIAEEVGRLAEEAERLRARGRELAAVKADKDAQARWALVKDLVDGRVFSWTDLLRRLERVMPPDVRLVSLSPEAHKGAVRLTVRAVAESLDGGIAFVRALEQREEFSDVYLLRADDRGGSSEFDYRLLFRPPPAPAGGAPPAVDVPGAGPEDEALAGDAEAAPADDTESAAGGEGEPGAGQRR